MNVRFVDEDRHEIVKTALALGFKGKSFLVTGATGMIGRELIEALREITDESKIILLGRDIDRLKEVFGKSNMVYLTFNMLGHSEFNVDYIIHLASPTSSKYLSEYPVETIDFVYSSTKKMLDWGLNHHARVLYASSMEAYGQVYDEKKKQENDLGFLSLESTRSSYPAAKRMCELLCFCYFKEYGANVNCVRLSQTFGAGTSIEDSRIFGYFCRCVRDNKDIVLKTKGDTVGNYCYISDTIKAFFYVLSRGEAGLTYNVVGDDNRSTIFNLAQMICKEIADNKIKVIVDIDNTAIYPSPTKLNMDNSRLKKLGWSSKFNIMDMFRRMIG